MCRPNRSSLVASNEVAEGSRTSGRSGHVGWRASPPRTGLSGHAVRTLGRVCRGLAVFPLSSSISSRLLRCLPSLSCISSLVGHSISLPPPTFHFFEAISPLVDPLGSGSMIARRGSGPCLPLPNSHHDRRELNIKIRLWMDSVTVMDSVLLHLLHQTVDLVMTRSI